MIIRLQRRNEYEFSNPRSGGKSIYSIHGTVYSEEGVMQQATGARRCEIPR
eukprot:COSAG06_NODE_58797_length_276_cov_0.581921_1_plen_50_part_10